MDLAGRLRLAWPKKYKTQKAFADAVGISKQHMSGILGGKAASPEVEEGLARALGISRSRLLDEDEGAFLAALEQERTEDGPSRSVDEVRTGVLCAFPTDSGVLADGSVVGRATYEVMRDPTGKGGMVLQLGHSRRGRKRISEFRDVPGASPNNVVLFVRERLEVRRGAEVDDIMKPEVALIISTTATPTSGDLVLVAKNIDWDEEVEPGSDDGLATVRLMRYVEADADGETLRYGWPIDGSKHGRVRLDGPYDVVGVVIGRWSAR